MVVDSSALYAILTGEPDAPLFARAIENADFLRISAATLLETDIVIESRYGAPGGDKLDELVQGGWLDTFREFYPEEPERYTYWDYFTRARERNVGWRIDYHWITADLRPALKNAFISDDVQGSDHCPVGIILNP